MPTSPSDPMPMGTVNRGFTLIELLVTLTLLVLVMTVAPALFSGSLGAAEVRAGARKIAAGLSLTRSRAIVSGRPQRFLLDLEARRFVPGDGGRPVTLAAGPVLTLETARSERLDHDRGGIRFFSDGSSTGGAVTLADGARRLRVSVDWLTGRIDVTEVE